MTDATPSLTVVPNLAGFSRGDDLARFLERGATPAAALRCYEALLRGDADRIAAIAAALERPASGPSTIVAAGHYIGVTLPAPDAEVLIAANVARPEVVREELHEREERRRW